MANLIEIGIFARNLTGPGFAAASANARGLGKVMNEMAKVSIAGLALVAGESIKMAADFQSSTTRLVTSAGETTKNIDMVRKGMLDMASQVGFSAIELSKGMYTVESAGYHGARGLTVLKAAAQGAKDENASLATVSNAVTDALVDYHMKVSDAANVTSKLVTAVSFGKTNFDTFSGAMSTVLPLASKLRISLADVTGVAATMTAHGVSAAQATFNIANAMRHLANPTHVQEKEFAALGITAKTVTQSLGTQGLQKTMELLSQTAKKAGKEGTPAYTQALAKLMGTAQGLNVALQTTGNNSDEAQKAIQGISKASADAKGNVAGFAEMQGTLKQQVAELGAGFDTLMITLGNKFIPILTSAVAWMNNNKQAVTLTLKALLALAAGIAIYSVAMKTAAIATGVFRVAQIALTAVLVGNPLAQAVIGIAALSYAFYAVTKSTNTSTDAINKNADAAVKLKSVWEGGSWTGNISQGWDTLTSALGTAWHETITLGGATDWLHKKLFGDNKWGPLSDSTNQATDATNQFSDAALGAKQSVEQETDALFHAGNAMQELSGSSIGLATAISEASASVKQNGRNLDINTAKGRANMSALNGIANAAQAQYTATLKAGQGSLTAGIQMNAARSSFIKLAMSMGDSRSQASALANALGLIHSKVVTIVTIFKNIGTSNPGITSGTAAAAMAGKASGGIVGYAAEGGPRNGLTWVGEHGPELVNLAPGSMVHSAGDSARLARDSGNYPPSGAHLARDSSSSGGGKTAALALKQLIDAMDGKITAIRTKFNAVIAIIKKEFSGNQEDSLVAYAKKQLASLEALAKKRDAVAAKLTDAKKFATDLAKSSTDFASLANLGGANTPVGIKINLEGKLAKMRQFATALKELAKRKLSRALFQQIAEAGPDAGLELAQNFLAMDPQLFNQVNAIQGQISKAATSIGSNTAEYLFGTKALEKLEASIQRAMDKSADKFASKIGAALSKASHHKGKASGGIAGGMTWVGEQGPELLNLPYGSSIYSSGDSRRMSGGSNGVTKIQIEWVGGNSDDEFMTWLRRNIRAVAGGGPNSVQMALS